MKYYFRNIKENDNKILIYTRITYPYKIKKKQFFAVNQVAFSIEITQNLGLKIYVYESDSKNNGPKLFEFSIDDSPITIGRNKCKVNLDFSILSKKHCVLKFDKEEKVWIITDGIEGRPSTNGTWLLVTSKFELNDTTFIKIGENIIKVSTV